MKTIFCLCLFGLLSFNITPQSVSTTGIAGVNLIVPLSVTALSGGIDFGEIILIGTQTTQTIQPRLGKQFRINGHPGRNITISYSPASLSTPESYGIDKVAVAILTFIPQVVDINNKNIINGNTYTIPNTKASNGVMDIWVGGSITIAENQAHGDYSGIFTISVSY